MIRRSLRFAALGAASLLVSVPAFAQLGSVTYTPPSAPPPPAAPSAPAVPSAGDAVAVPVGQAAAAPMATTGAPMAVVPRVAEDMSGSLGFGVGVIAGTSLITIDKSASVKIWTSDSMAIVPALSFNFSKPKEIDATWNLDPEVVLLFVPWKTTSTRFELGGGIGFGVGKNPAMSTETRLDIRVPVQAGVEHFFAHWFSMGIAARMNLFDFYKVGDAQTVSFSVNSTALLAQLFFYTD